MSTYNENGYMSLRPQTGDVNYQPSTNKPEIKDDAKFKYSRSEFANVTTVQSKISKSNDFAQAGDLYRSFSKKDQDALIFNLSGALKQIKNKVIVAKMIAHFYQADSDYGIRLAKELKMDRKELESLMMQ